MFFSRKSAISRKRILPGDRTRTEFKRDSYATFAACKGDGSNSLSSAVEQCVTVGENTVGSESNSKSKRALVDICEISAFVEKLCCPQCKNVTLTFRTDSKKAKGLAVHADVVCTTCEETVTEGYLASKSSDGGKDFAINRQAVFSALVSGLGSTTFNNFCESMDLQGMHHKAFHSKANKLYAKLGDLENRGFFLKR